MYAPRNSYILCVHRTKHSDLMCKDSKLTIINNKHYGENKILHELKYLLAYLPIREVNNEARLLDMTFIKLIRLISDRAWCILCSDDYKCSDYYVVTNLS